MKHRQGQFIFASITVIIKGRNIETVLQSLINKGYPVWDIKKTSDIECQATIYEHHVIYLKELINYYDMQVIERKVSGGTSYLKKLLVKKEWILSFGISVLFIFLLAHTAWKVEVNGVSVHLEDKIKANLAELGLYQGAWIYNLDSLDKIQDQVLHDLPELLYLGIRKQGVTYHIEALEKKLEKELTITNSKQLIANKSGVISKMFIKSGHPLVEINDVVQKGDVLVSDDIATMEETDEDNEDKKAKKVPVNGKVYANTWYDMAITTSLHPEQNKLTGDKTKKYQLQVNNKNVPLWGFWRSPYDRYVTSEKVKSLHLWKWNLPVEIIEQTLYEFDEHQLKRTLPEAQEVAIEHIKDHLKTTLGQDVEILKYYVLHESVENGKVNMNIYLSVLENIAIENE